MFHMKGDSLEHPITLGRKLSLFFRRVVAGHHPHIHTGILCDVFVLCLTVHGSLQANLAKNVNAGTPIGQAFGPINNTVIKPIAEVVGIKIGSDSACVSFVPAIKIVPPKLLGRRR